FVFPDYDVHVTDFMGMGAASGVLFVLLTKWNGLNQPANLTSPGGQIQSVAFAWIWVLTLFAAFLFLQKSGASLSRGSTVAFAVATPLFLMISRGLAGSRLRERVDAGMIAGPRVIVVGDRMELSPLSADGLRRHYGVEEVRRFE